MTRLYLLHQNRVRMVSLLFLLINILILSRMLFIQSFKSAELRRNTHNIGLTERSVKGSRGHIYDRNGEVLAESIHRYTFWVNSQEDFEKEKIVELFSSELNQPENGYRQLLKQNKPYIRLVNGLLRTECTQILAQLKNIKGLHCDISINRYYPYNNLVSQIVGYVDMNHTGQFGIEHQFDPVLSGKTSRLVYNRAADGRIREAFMDQQPKIINGVDIQLTVDVALQAILVDALKKGLKKSHAVSANGVILNPFTGDVLAMASIPDFDPNNYKTHNIATFANLAISQSYEPGSTFKLIAMTAILESGLYKSNDMIYCEEGEYQLIPSKLIHDHEPYGNLSLSEVFIHSSNIGLTKAVDQLGAEHIYDYARKFGFGIRTGIPLPSETSGILRAYNDWSRLSGPSVSMGQEIAVNTLQLALAYSAAANGGYLPSARIIKNISGKEFKGRNFSPSPIRQVMSKETSSLLLEMMEGVVNEGTATKARIPGFRIGGKTGTAEKFIDGQYSKRNFISSFAAVLPVNDPKYVCVISVDSPRYGYHWGNETAAPIVKEIFERIIINNNMDPVAYQNIAEITPIDLDKHSNGMLSTDELILQKESKVPNFLGKTLKQSIQEAKLTGLMIRPVGTSGRVVWQSVSPGKQIRNNITCQIKLESL